MLIAKPLESWWQLNTVNGCWEWIGGLYSNGYGAYHKKRKTYLAHRYVYERYKKTIETGKQLDHLCKNKKCVNPDHLEEVTAQINTRRAVALKISDEQVLEMRRLYSTGMKISQIALKYGMKHNRASEIVYRQKRITI